MFEKQLELPEEFDGNVRLFPLPNLVLFPCNLQPLHIFESRYCEMFEDAINNDSLITMATLRPDYEFEYHSRPPIADHVCVGRVVDHRKREDGTYDLMLVGIKRAVVVEEKEPVRSYREATVRIIEDLTESPSTQGEVAQELVQRLLKVAPDTRSIIDVFRNGEIELRHFVDVLAFSYPFEMEFELKLLGEPSPKRRAELILQQLPNDPPKKQSPPPFSVN